MYVKDSLLILIHTYKHTSYMHTGNSRDDKAGQQPKQHHRSERIRIMSMCICIHTRIQTYIIIHALYILMSMCIGIHTRIQTYIIQSHR